MTVERVQPDTDAGAAGPEGEGQGLGREQDADAKTVLGQRAEDAPAIYAQEEHSNVTELLERENRLLEMLHFTTAESEGE